MTIERPHSSFTRTTRERQSRPSEVRRLRFDDLIQSRTGPRVNAITAGSFIVPLEAVQPGDTQVLAAAEPRTYPGGPPLSLDRLASTPSVESVVASTEIKLGERLGSVQELLFMDGRAPIPDSRVFGALPRLQSLHVISVHSQRPLRVEALAGLELRDLGVTWERMARGEMQNLAALAGLRRLVVDAGPAESVADIGRLEHLTYLHLRGGRSGWARLAPLARLEEAYLFETGLPDLRALNGWTRLINLALLGRRLNSLEGIGALGALESCSLTAVGVRDLEPVRGLDNLKILHLSSLAVDDLGPLADLPSLLELTLHQPIATGEWHIRSLAPLAGLKRLEKLNIWWVAVGDRDLAAFRKARPDVVIDVAHSAKSATLAIGPVQVHPPSAENSEWWILQDLTRLLGTETNVEAEARLKSAVANRSNRLLARLNFDSEASAVGVSAAAEADIREVAEVIAELAN